ncbi:Nif3-like dinuclear metal center hexameric protein [Ichthyenterobacterium sp. W332]|uniref:GTP cyclohydrolase 1 type 2 homolog n=1 Tax=Microcosmobacter mediterraneus TaxID=3075607 RepID=A0ABU2YJH6_9FLAO|nr:Nif3-like dinuclear metal center hexameric protein [Ichthyenterobacterium sp. W332]MDT0558319.1 Nif3-like dinuclear metal center hexameric protein [Ichthyenterobacterium sp. W332]
MIIQDVITILEDLAPSHYAEDFDNVGLLVGDKNITVEGILVTLDTLEAVVDEAIEKKCNLIVSFHPIIFKGLKKLTGKTYVERVVVKAIQHNIAIFAIHTALDNALLGVNDIICNTLGLVNKQILIPQKGTIKKLTTYVPNSSAELLRSKLFESGAGALGNYELCSFNTLGIGTYKGNENSNPVIGKKGQLQSEEETMISVTFMKHRESQVIKSLFEAHPYEEVAYEITTLDNINQNIGMGMIGELPNEVESLSVLKLIKDKMKAGSLRYSAIHKNTIKKIAVLGGSGAFAISAAKAANADLFVTADLKYHDFFTAEDSIILADIGHYESEQYTKSFLVDYLSKKITNFAPALAASKVVLSTTNTNPVKYL